MKRVHIINKPTSTDDLADIDFENYTNAWQLKAERLEAKQRRNFKRQYV